MLNLILFTIVGFCLMEIASYILHRYLFHGILWKIHESHHRHTHGPFELNDVFSVVFAAIAIALMITGADTFRETASFGIGLGITLYGILYFIIHDIFTHKRFVNLKSENKLIQLVKRAHQNHHQDVGQKGQEPYGLFLFPYDKYPKKERKNS